MFNSVRCGQLKYGRPGQNIFSAIYVNVVDLNIMSMLFRTDRLILILSHLRYVRYVQTNTVKDK